MHVEAGDEAKNVPDDSAIFFEHAVHHNHLAA